MAGGWEGALRLDGVYFSSLHGNCVKKKGCLEEMEPLMEQRKRVSGDPAEDT